jgi:hypothetical protein
MPYNGKSPTEINLAAMFGGAAKGNLSEDQVAKLERMAGRRTFGGSIARTFLKKYQASQTQTAGVAGAATPPSVVQTAGATNIGQRINTIESRLGALESGGTTAGGAQPVEAAPPTDMGGEAMPADTSAAAMPVDIPAAPQMPAAQEPIIPQSEQLGSLMASPFTMRQRANMGPLNLNSPLNGNAFAKAVQDAKVSGASTFEVGGKTYNVK